MTGPDPVPIEIVGPSRDSVHGEIIECNDLRNTHEEADNIILHQVSGYSRTKHLCFSMTEVICSIYIVKTLALVLYLHFITGFQARVNK